MDVDTMRRVVTGEEPLEVASPADTAAVKRHAAKGFQVLLLRDVPDVGSNAEGWQELVRHADVVLRVREGIAPAKLNQSRHIAALVHSLFSDESAREDICS